MKRTSSKLLMIQKLGHEIIMVEYRLSDPDVPCC